MLESLNKYQFILAALNLIILYLILRKILFKPVTEFMENRTKSIQDSIKDSEKQKADAEDMKRKYEKQLKEAKADSEKIIDEATAKANRISDKVIDDAKQEAQLILADARIEIEHEREQMIKAVRNEVAGLALAAATKVMEANMDKESNRVLVDKFLDEAGVA